ncbi:MAG: SdpI family protein [Thermotaleaceae bacterium]
MKINKWILLISILSIVGIAVIYPSLPQEIPGHWNAAGEVNRYDHKSTLFITGLLPLAIYLMMVFVPKIDPKRAAYLKHAKAYSIAQWMVVLLLIYIQWIAIAAGLGYGIDTGIAIRLALGVVFIVLGNFMSQIRHNYFFGIRNPWTLSNEQVWKKTHRVGGYGFVIVGAISILTFFLKGSVAFMVTMVSLGIMVSITFVYSYLAYKKTIEK